MSGCPGLLSGVTIGTFFSLSGPQRYHLYNGFIIAPTTYVERFKLEKEPTKYEQHSSPGPVSSVRAVPCGCQGDTPVRPAPEGCTSAPRAATG